MSDGQGGDAGGHFCGDHHSAASGSADAGGYSVGGDGRTPIPDIMRITLNGAPVTEASHELVLAEPAKSAFVRQRPGAAAR